MQVPSVRQMTFFEQYYAGALICEDNILSLSITVLVPSVIQMTFFEHYYARALCCADDIL